MNNELLSTYDILEQIGQGSGGVVYKAYHKRLQKTVVLKKITNAGRGLQQNRQEVDILKNLNNTYLPQVLDFLETDEGVFTVMNYIPGKSFQQLLYERARFTKEDLLRWALQICSALDYLHTREIPIIHGDIKPSNIMLRPDGNICLIDFNISFFFDENNVLGYTRGYTSPEQFWAVSSKKKREDVYMKIDEKADIYSVGATLYHLATGNVRADYSHRIDIEKLAMILGERFARVIEKATNLDPTMRYQSAYEMYQALSLVPEESARALKEKQRGKNKIIALVVAIVLAVGMAAGGYLAFQKHKVSVYDDYVAQAKSDVLKGDLASAGQSSEKAIDVFDDKAEGYYWKDYILFCQGRYEDCDTTIADEIGKVKKDTESADEHKSIVDLYCLQATSCLEINRLSDAVACFETAEEKYSNLMRAEHYRDYAVALARDGQIDLAEEKIKKAETAPYPLKDYSISYTEGEIQMASGKTGEAMGSFRSAVDSLEKARNLTSEDEYLMNRAYMSMYKIYDDRKDYRRCLDTMQEAEEHMSPAWHPQINRKAADACYNMENYRGAADRYSKVVQTDGATADDWYKLANSYIACRDPGAADSAAEGYIKRLNTAPDHSYWFIKARAEEVRLAPNDRADYSRFLQYYNNAKACPATNGNYDNEEAILDRDYSEIVRKGYL